MSFSGYIRTRDAARRPQRRLRKIAAGLLAAGLILAGSWTIVAAPEDDDAAIATSLATMLRAGRTVISNSQPQINDPAVGDKGLDGKAVLAQAIALYRKATGVDPATIDAATRHGRLLRAEMDAIVEVMNENQGFINAKGVGFKAFIPAVFARLVDEQFARNANGDAAIKVTAPEYLIRNRKARPDPWEDEVIKSRFLGPDVRRGEAYSAIVDADGRKAFRMMIPEYYAASCLSCHGSPQGEIDITGYPKEGGNEGDLGAVISLILYQK